MQSKNDIRAHDPFIVTDQKRGCYFWAQDSLLTGREGRDCGGVDIRRSTDLKNFEEPTSAWRPPKDFFAQWQYWAPELHYHNGNWYMFTTTTGEMKGSGIETGAFPKDKIRGTMVFISDKPEGPYEPWSDGPLTPHDMLTLDGTFYVDKNNKPWMVYCHEWLQVIDGTMEAIPLSDDLKKAIGEPIHLFKSSDAPWSTGGYCESYDGVVYQKTIHVTDGCFMFKDLSGGLCMLWTTSSKGAYTTGIARSPNGEITGPWMHSENPIYDKDGGHPMLFKTLEGKDMIAMHSNHHKRGEERLLIYPVKYTDTGLIILEE